MLMIFTLFIGVSALVAQFPDVDQFRWVGYFNVVLGILAAFFIIILFHGEYKCNAKMNNNETEKAKCWKRLPQLNGNCIRITVSCVLRYCTQVLLYKLLNVCRMVKDLIQSSHVLFSVFIT